MRSTSPGSPGITGWLAGKDWTFIPTTRQVVALTFDAGANADAVSSILGTLRREGVPATFFLTGNFVRDFPAAARSIAAAGLRIGDHAITHPYLTQLSDTAAQREIAGGAQQIMSVTGKSTAPLFRFPYGDADARTIAIANRAGFVPVRWTVDTLGWEGTAGHISASVVVSTLPLLPGARRARRHIRLLATSLSGSVRQRSVSTAWQRLMSTAVAFAAPAESRPTITALSAG